MDAKRTFWQMMLAASGLTFTACPVAYGAPWAEYSVKGRVVDPEGTPIASIAVSFDYCPFDGDHADELLASGYSPDAWTDTEGRFHIRREESFAENILCLHDVDGPQNGGEFEAQRVEINFVQTGKGSGKGWYEGSFEAHDIEVVMMPKRAEDEEENE